MIVDMTVSTMQQRFEEEHLAQKKLVQCINKVDANKPITFEILRKESKDKRYSKLNSLHKDASVLIKDSLPNITWSSGSDISWTSGGSFGVIGSDSSYTITASDSGIVFDGPVEFKSSVSFEDTVTFPDNISVSYNSSPVLTNSNFFVHYD
ncbi:MAG: hypothetical protein ACXAC5_00585 [Promethearchaeota archaeon]|jgi:hypothetical protein